jgi:hypothetical protein
MVIFIMRSKHENVEPKNVTEQDSKAASSGSAATGVRSIQEGLKKVER